ncbi:hypothetical protein M430DRAFT_29918 [Amorphotheca resinae ATCC 22711]|uniref:Uncharacterized protein n=1 Tax=Amorphotheca resinae ATCC 22711 TaxID=857342 RepID=A0A2T3AU52_AMORE|nr:hypothetical protein M430DRAFT_29918 [Amorphotheca resinae ATCC 22711]PSS12188.1 hypothetical protein M430DRAFT_29918 [Amorphotheca resinae ATCC 22711]
MYSPYPRSQAYSGDHTQVLFAIARYCGTYPDIVYHTVCTQLDAANAAMPGMAAWYFKSALVPLLPPGPVRNEMYWMSIISPPNFANHGSHSITPELRERDLPTCQETQGKFRTNARKIPDKRKGKSQQTQGSKQAQGTVQTNTRDSAEEVLNPPVQRAFSAKGVKHPTYDLELVRTNDHKPFFVFQDLVQYRSTAYPGSPQIDQHWKPLAQQQDSLPIRRILRGLPRYGARFALAVFPVTSEPRLYAVVVLHNHEDFPAAQVQV